MNFDSEAIAWRHAKSKALPKRRFRRRVGICRPVSGARSRRRCAPAQPRAARGLQRAQMGGGENRLSVALHAPRLAAMGGSLPADEAVATGERFRGDGPRFARTLAAFGGQSARSDSSHTRLSHPTAVYSRERLPGRLRRSKAQEGFEGIHAAAVDTLGHLLALFWSAQPTSRTGSM